MIKIRTFPHNEKGKIEFTKEELQKLLNEVYNEGWLIVVLFIMALAPYL